MNKTLMAELEKLDADERIRLAYDLLESVVATMSGAPITDAQQQEIRRRLAEYRVNPDEPVATLADIRRQLGVA